MNPRAMLARSGKKYASIARYRDSGRATIVFGYSREEESASFTTVFVRQPKRFHFDLRRGNGTVEFLRADGDSLESDPSVKAVSLADGVAALTGVTMGAAHTIVRMLLPSEIGGRSIADSPRARAIGAEVLGGEDCAVIALDVEANERVWLGRDSSCVRRVSSRLGGLLTVVLEIEPE